jgi:hypothetical protein
MLDADMNVRIYGYLGRRYGARDKYTKIFLALMSSGTVASWGFWSEVEILWKMLSGISAAIAVALPILNYQKMIESIAEQKREWTHIRNEYEKLWLSLKSLGGHEVEKKYDEIKRLETARSALEASLPHDKNLINKCYDEVLVSRGLETTR